MGWWAWLLGPRGPEPVGRVDDAVFGPLMWSGDDEAWLGEYCGYRIAIGYTDSATPAPKLLNYVRDFLGLEGTTFTRNLAKARAGHAHEFERCAREFAGLRVGTLGFWLSDRGMGCFVDLIGGELNRSWFVEFEEMRCLGFAFDT
jgi:hypothetical protein